MSGVFPFNLAGPISQLSQAPPETGCIRVLPTAISGRLQQPFPVASSSHFRLPPSATSCCRFCVLASPDVVRSAPLTPGDPEQRPWVFWGWMKSSAECQGPCLVFFSLVALNKCYVHRKPLRNNFWLANFPQTVRSPTSGQGVEFSTHLQSPVCISWAVCNQWGHLVLRCRAGESRVTSSACGGY